MEKKEQPTEPKPLRISDLKGKVTPMTSQEIDTQLNDLRGEWERKTETTNG